MAHRRWNSGHFSESFSDFCPFRRLLQWPHSPHSTPASLPKERTIPHSSFGLTPRWENSRELLCNLGPVVNTMVSWTWAFPVVQWSRTRLPMQEMHETWVQSLSQEDPLEKEMAAHSSILACEILWTEEHGGLQSMGSQRVRHDWATE